jgi:hypothetical protein
MSVIKASVTSEIKTRVQACAKGHRLSESEFLRRAVLAAIAEEGQPCHPIEPDAGRSDITRATVRLPRFLMDAATDRAAAKGLAPSRWISALVQSNLLRLPVVTHRELEVLGASNRELAAIGRNLNQIARAINEASRETDRLRKDMLEELRQAIAENRSAIRALTRASQNSWDASSGNGTD